MSYSRSLRIAIPIAIGRAEAAIETTALPISVATVGSLTIRPISPFARIPRPTTIPAKISHRSCARSGRSARRYRKTRDARARGVMSRNRASP